MSTLTNTDRETLIGEATRLRAEGPQGIAEARRILEAQLRADPDWYEPLDLEAEILTQIRNGNLARRLLEEYLRYHPGNGAASARLAWVQWQMGLRDEAMAEIKAALARDASNRHARTCYLGWMCDSGDYPTVLAEAEKGLEINPDDRELQLFRGRAATQLKDSVRAHQSFRKLLELDPGDEEARREYADFLLSQNLADRAHEVLLPVYTKADASPRTILKMMDCCFRRQDHPAALHAFQQLVSDRRITDESFIRETIGLLQHYMGPGGSEEYFLRLLTSAIPTDGFTVELLKRCVASDQQRGIARLYELVSARALAYPQTMMRLMSMGSSTSLRSGAIEDWIRMHPLDISQSTLLWGGVGAWYVQRNRWQEAVHHLSAYPGRQDVQPWMILLLGRALEALDAYSEANRHYRIALELPPDHTEASVRSRLAFNLALEGLPGSAQVILIDCSEEGKRTSTVDDLVRIFAVEALSLANQMESPDEVSELFRSTMEKMKEAAKEDKYSESLQIIKVFRRKAMEVMSRMGRRL